MAAGYQNQYGDGYDDTILLVVAIIPGKMLKRHRTGFYWSIS
jgi:hypothetical protein